MISPKSRHKPPKREFQPVEHTNKPFYNLKRWKDTRKVYKQNYQDKIFKEVPNGYWIDRLGRKRKVSVRQQTFILSKGLVCEKCMRLYLADAREENEVFEGFILDHIDPVNPDNALDTMGGIYGDPFSFDNFQLLCRKCDNKKRQGSDKAFHNNIKKKHGTT